MTPEIKRAPTLLDLLQAMHIVSQPLPNQEVRAAHLRIRAKKVADHYRGRVIRVRDVSALCDVSNHAAQDTIHYMVAAGMATFHHQGVGRTKFYAIRREA